jgi:hypothetical protein
MVYALFVSHRTLLVERALTQEQHIAYRGLSSTHKQEAHPFLSIDRFHSSAKAMHYEWRGLIPCAFIDGLLTKARKLVRTPPCA